MGRTADAVPASLAEQKPKADVRASSALPPVSVIPSDITVGIMGIGVEYPPTVVRPEELETFVARHYEITPAMQKTLMINRNTGIKTRSVFHGPEDPLLNSPKPADIAQISASYLECVVPLAVSAARKAIAEWGGDISTLTHMVSVTTSDTRNPGFDYYVAQQLGLSPHIERTLLHGVGCTGGLAALRTATNLALSAKVLGKKANVLCVAAEGLSMFARTGMDDIIKTGHVNPAITLFSDCATSFILSAELPERLPTPLTESVEASAESVEAPVEAVEVAQADVSSAPVETPAESTDIPTEPVEAPTASAASAQSVEVPHVNGTSTVEVETPTAENVPTTNGATPNGIEKVTPQVATPSPRGPIYTVTAYTFSTIPSTADDLAIPVTPHGYMAYMSKRVPFLTAAATPVALTAILTKLGLNVKPSELDWALHPGGAAVLKAVEQTLSLTAADHTRASWEVYTGHGNSSAATIVSVLNTMRKPGYGERDNVVAVAFGPGVNIEMALLKRA